MVTEEQLDLEWWDGIRDPRFIIYDALRSAELISIAATKSSYTRAVDIGAGAGKLCEQLAVLGYPRIVAVEPNSLVVDMKLRPLAGTVLKRYNSTIEVWQAPAQEYSLRGKLHGDIVTMTHVSHEFAPAELYTVLLGINSTKLVFDLVSSKSLYAWWTKKRGLGRASGHQHNPRLMKMLLEEAGWTVKTTGFGFIPQISLLSGWRLKMPALLTKWSLKYLDRYFTDNCHMVMFECTR